GDLLVQLVPQGQPVEVVGPVRRLRAGGAGVAGGGVVVGGGPLRAEVVARQVDQLAADQGGGEAQEVLGGGQGHVAQGAVEAHQDVLEDVAGVLPAVDA